MERASLTRTGGTESEGGGEERRNDGGGGTSDAADTEPMTSDDANAKTRARRGAGRSGDKDKGHIPGRVREGRGRTEARASGRARREPSETSKKSEKSEVGRRLVVGVVADGEAGLLNVRWVGKRRLPCSLFSDAVIDRKMQAWAIHVDISSESFRGERVINEKGGGVCMPATQQLRPFNLKTGVVCHKVRQAERRKAHAGDAREPCGRRPPR